MLTLIMVLFRAVTLDKSTLVHDKSIVKLYAARVRSMKLH